MNFNYECLWFLMLILPLTYSQIDESRRQRNPFEFYQIGPKTVSQHDVHYHHHSDDHVHHSHREARLHSIPPPGTSEYVRHFARQTSGEENKGHDIHHHHGPTIRYVAEPACCDTVVETVKHVVVPDNHHNHDHKDPHSSHRNFLTAGVNRYYAVRSPASHEPHAPIVGVYHSSYANRDRGGKLYLGNRPFYF